MEIICHIYIMSVQGRSIHRSKMSSRERELRSSLRQITCSQAIIRGTLLHRERSCGKTNCKCAQGKKHPALCLVVSEDARQRQIFIPKFLEAEIRLWVAQYQNMRKIEEEISKIYLNKLKKREVS